MDPSHRSSACCAGVIDAMCPSRAMKTQIARMSSSRVNRLKEKDTGRRRFPIGTSVAADTHERNRAAGLRAVAAALTGEQLTFARCLAVVPGREPASVTDDQVKVARHELALRRRRSALCPCSKDGPRPPDPAANRPDFPCSLSLLRGHWLGPGAGQSAYLFCQD